MTGWGCTNQENGQFCPLTWDFPQALMPVADFNRKKTRRERQLAWVFGRSNRDIVTIRSRKGREVGPVGSPLIVGDSALGNGTTSSDEIRLMLARELHDRVAQTLTTMLIELENFKVEQTGRQSALRQLGELQESTRDVLTN